MKTLVRTLSLCSLLFTTASSICFGQQWADLTMQVILDGDIPAPKTPKPIGLGAISIVPPDAEDFLVEPKSKGIANVVFMLDSKRTRLAVNQMHPDLQLNGTEAPILEAKNYRFSPHVQSIRSGQTLIEKNSGPNGTNFNVPFLSNNASNIFLQDGEQRELEITQTEPWPIPVASNLYPWMRAYLFVVDHPYVGISDAEGSIKIEKLPAGIELTFKLWHEFQNKHIEHVTLNGQEVIWHKGFVKLTLKAGKNDLGTLLIKRQQFKE